MGRRSPEPWSETCCFPVQWALDVSYTSSVLQGQGKEKRVCSWYFTSFMSCKNDKLQSCQSWFSSYPGCGMHSLYTLYHFPVKTVAGFSRAREGESHVHALIKISSKDKHFHMVHVHFLSKIMTIYVVNGQQSHNSFFASSKNFWK